MLAVSGDVITVEAEDMGYRELAEIRTAAGMSLAQVIRLDGKKVSLQVLAGSRGISTNDQVRFLKRPIQVSCSENLMGRIFTGSGAPLDKGPALSENVVDIGGPPVNPAKRIIPNKTKCPEFKSIPVLLKLVAGEHLSSIPSRPVKQNGRDTATKFEAQ